MAFKLKNKETLGEGICRIAHEQAGCIADSLKTKRGQCQLGAVHEARKSVKKLRALVRLIADGLGERTLEEENRTFRKIGRALSPLRDAEVLVKTLEKLRGRYKKQTTAATFASALKLFKAQRNSVVKHLSAPIKKVRKRLRKSIQRIDDWPLKALQWDDLYCGIRRAYKEARQAFAAACDQPNDENFHEWRKRVKELWYDLRILGAVRPEVMDDLAHQAKVLGEYLGEDHDLAVAGRALEEKRLNKASSQVLASLIERRRFQLQRAAFDLGNRLFVEKPKAFAQRIEGYWKTWRAEVRN